MSALFDPALPKIPISSDLTWLDLDQSTQQHISALLLREFDFQRTHTESDIEDARIWHDAIVSVSIVCPQLVDTLFKTGLSELTSKDMPDMATAFMLIRWYEKEKTAPSSGTVSESSRPWKRVASVPLAMRFLDEDDRDQLEELVSQIEENLSDDAFWLPIDDIAREHFLDPEWTFFIGSFEGDRLVAASALFLNEHEYAESARAAGLSGAGCEIGRCMVLPDHRGENLMLVMNRILVTKALELEKPWILATAHPDNVASCASLRALGMGEKISIVKHGSYPRNVFALTLS